LRDSFQRRILDEKLSIFIPEPVFCTDNAAMIAYLGYTKLSQGIQSALDMAPEVSLRLEQNIYAPLDKSF
jgi:tRNA A37 threonylcarbamoyltransferase TsaD